MQYANNTNYSESSKTINSKLILGNHTNKIIANYYFGYNLICIKSNIIGFNKNNFSNKRYAKLLKSLI